jgi:formate-dependent nitrite reductase membrane component NrfD
VERTSSRPIGALLTAWLIASYLGGSSALSVIEPLGAIFALLSAVYTAFLFAQAKGRDFWQSPMLGLHMIIHALMAGAAVILISLRSRYRRVRDFSLP